MVFLRYQDSPDRMLQSNSAVDQKVEVVQTKEEQHRRQQSQNQGLVAVFENCVFQFNEHPHVEGFTSGVLHVEGPQTRVAVRNSIFHDNFFGDEVRTVCLIHSLQDS